VGMTENQIVIYIPTPISANRMFTRNLTRRGKLDLTHDYAAWRDVASWDAKRQLVGVSEIMGFFDIAIEIPSSRGDLDNYAKATLDLLQLIHCISNDANANSVSISRRPGRDGCMVVLTPRPDLVGKIRAPAKLTYRRSRPRTKQRKGGITSAMLLGLRS